MKKNYFNKHPEGRDASKRPVKSSVPFHVFDLFLSSRQDVITEFKVAPASLEDFESEVQRLSERLRGSKGRDVVVLEAPQLLAALEERPRSLSCWPLAKCLSEAQLLEVQSFLREAKEARMWRQEANGQYHLVAWALGHQLRLSVISEDVPVRIAVAKVSIG